MNEDVNAFKLMKLAIEEIYEILQTLRMNQVLDEDGVQHFESLADIIKGRTVTGLPYETYEK